MKKGKALALMSGGLDSAIAAKIIQQQGIEILGLTFAAPFNTKSFLDGEKNVLFAEEVAKSLGIPVRRMEIEKDYLKLITNPKFGLGKNVNPCIDCKIYMLKRAKKIMNAEGYDFIITGEVVGQRPKSQKTPALRAIEKASGLKGKILRPLSAKILPETIPEKKGLVDREKLFEISGRGRNTQIDLAKKLGITKHGTPAGGCLLTDPEYSKKVKELMDNEGLSLEALEMLKYGRHFRMGKNRILVGRTEKDNLFLEKIRGKKDFKLELANDLPGPTTLVKGPKDDEAIMMAARITVRYSNRRDDLVKVICEIGGKTKEILAAQITDKEIDPLRI